MFLMAIYYFIKKTPFHFRLSRTINPAMQPLLTMALNLFVRSLALKFAIYLANAYATGYGKNYIAAQRILMNIWLFFSFFIDGYASAGNAISGTLLVDKSYRNLSQMTTDVRLTSVVV